MTFKKEIETEFKIISPVDQRIYSSVTYQSVHQIQKNIELSANAQKSWKNIHIEERKRICKLFVENIVNDKEEIATELSWLIGRSCFFNLDQERKILTKLMDLKFVQII
jgi:acyl-CoA reductase-like NAD-dependent aldehyde dehydrogenase